MAATARTRSLWAVDRSRDPNTELWLVDYFLLVGMAATARNLNKGSRGNGNVALVISDDQEKPQQLVVGEW